MGTYHWVNNGFTMSPIGFATAFPTCNVAIPAGCTVKRVIIYNTACDGIISSTGPLGAMSMHAQMKLAWIPTGLPSHTIFEGTRGTPWTVTVDDFSAGINPIYSCFPWGGDEIFGANLKCSLGKAGGPAATVALTGIFQTLAAHGVTPTYRIQFAANIKALYYQP